MIYLQFLHMSNRRLSINNVNEYLLLLFYIRVFILTLYNGVGFVCVCLHVSYVSVLGISLWKHVQPRQWCLLVIMGVTVGYFCNLNLIKNLFRDTLRKYDDRGLEVWPVCGFYLYHINGTMEFKFVLQNSQVCIFEQFISIILMLV